MPVRERIDRLIDPGSPFLEPTPLAADGMYDDDAPGAGMVTGIGKVSGTDCDRRQRRDVKGGTYYPMTVKKHLRAQEIALENRLPCIYLSTRRRASAAPGRRVPRSRALRPHLLQPGAACPRKAFSGRAGDGLIDGRRSLCAGHERRDGHRPRHRHDFPGGPPSGEGRDRRDVTAEELGGASVHARISGVADHEALDDEHALAIGREIIDGLSDKSPITVGSTAQSTTCSRDA